MKKNATNFQKELNVMIVDSLLEDFKKIRGVEVFPDLEQLHIGVIYKGRVRMHIQVFSKYFHVNHFNEYHQVFDEDNFYFAYDWDIENFKSILENWSGVFRKMKRDLVLNRRKLKRH